MDNYVKNKDGDMDTLGKRIKHIRKKIGLNQSDFAKKLGLDSPVAISKYELDQREPDISKLVKMSEFGSISLDWLLTGEDVSGKGDVAPVEFEPVREAAVVARPDDFVYLPVVRGEISAGQGRYPDEQVETCIAFRRDWISRKGNPARMTLIRVSGDSMEPTLSSGDMALVDHGRDYVNPEGGIYAVSLDDVIMVKRLQLGYPAGIVRIISDNPRYSSFDVPIADVHVNGRVIWIGREVG